MNCTPGELRAETTKPPYSSGPTEGNVNQLILWNQKSRPTVC